MDSFNGKGAIITGAASGIGYAMAKHFLKEGMKVVIADVDKNCLNEAAEKLRSISGSVTPVVTDVSNSESVRQLAQMARETLGEIHIVCNNAGVISAGSLWESSVDEYNWLMGVNVWGIIHGIREFVPILKEQSCESHIVNTASMGALATMAYSGIYYMTKAAALSLSETLYQELLIEAPHVGVTCLCPEFVKTQISSAERNRPESGDFSDTDMKAMVLQNLSEFTSGDEAISPDELVNRLVEAIKEKRFYAITTEDNPWYLVMNERFKAIQEAGNPPFLVPTTEGVQSLK